jgi:CHAT domain-containing protein
LTRWFGAAVLAPLALLLGCGSQRNRSPASSVQSAGDSLLARGESLYVTERFAAARSVWTVALRQSRAAHDSVREAWVLTWLGLVAARLGDVREARGLGEEALTLKLRLGLSKELSPSHHALGLVALSENRNEDAVRAFEAAMTTARAANDTKGIAKAAGGLGLAYTYLGDYPRARESHRAARDAARRLGDIRLEANGLANEAMLDIWEGVAPPAIARLDTARALYRRVGFGAGEENALGQLATAFELTGEEDRAFAALDSALTIARRLGLGEEEADLLRLLGGLHVRVGDYRRALRYYAEAEALMRGAGLAANLGSLLRGSADAEVRLGNLPRAEKRLREALRLHLASAEPSEHLNDLLLGAEIDFRRGGMERAGPRLREARTVADRLNTRGTRVAVALAEADLADRANDSRRVLGALRGAAPNMAAGDFGSEWLASALAARAHARLGALDSAVIEGRKAVAAVERLRGGLASEALRATYVTDRAEVYGDLVLALLRLNRSAEAFAVADGARSRGLFEHLTTARTGTSGALTREMLEGESLLRRIDSLVKRLQETAPRIPRERGAAAELAGAPILAALSDARSHYEALVLRAAQGDLRSDAVLGVRPARLDQVREALEPGEVLLEYLLTKDRLLLFVVTRTGLQTLESALDGPGLSQRARLIRDLWSVPSADWKHGLAASRALDSVLIAPARNAGVLSGAKRILVVPHGLLGQVPFAALQDQLTGHFLAQDYAVVHLPSAAALAVLRGRLPGSGGTLEVGEGFAPFPDQLPSTLPELQALRASLPGVEIRTGRQATESAVRRALAGGGLVHVATHGILNVNNPMFSRIELSRGLDAGEDGRLEVHELLGMQIRSPLVFFSGCETGASLEWTDDPLRGTGDLTLAQAVLAAGAGNVIMTLWRIDDAGAAVFAGRFYRNLTHLPVADAFSAAQREMVADARYVSPYYWAGYTLSGTGRLGAQDASAASVPVREGLGPRSQQSQRSRP